jgi:hypothetical protein
VLARNNSTEVFLKPNLLSHASPKFMETYYGNDNLTVKYGIDYGSLGCLLKQTSSLLSNSLGVSLKRRLSIASLNDSSLSEYNVLETRTKIIVGAMP